MPAEVRFYQEQGYLPLPGLVDAGAVAGLREETLRVVREHFGLTEEDLGHAKGAADKLRQSTRYLASMRLNELVNGDAVKAVAATLIGGPATVYMPFTAVKAGGGGGQFHFHQDNNYTHHEPALGSINIWVALDDMTPDNGCLMVVPGSHKQGQAASRNSDDGDQHQQVDVPEQDRLPLRMRAGDAVAFTRLTLHGSGPNTTHRPRVAYALQFHRQDVSYRDKTDGQLKRLIDTPRYQVGPVESLRDPAAQS